MPTKQATSFRLSDEALTLIRELSAALGVSQAAVIEMAVRKIAKQHIDAGLVERERDN
jgi:hypothetical protein